MELWQLADSCWSRLNLLDFEDVELCIEALVQLRLDMPFFRGAELLPLQSFEIKVIVNLAHIEIHLREWFHVLLLLLPAVLGNGLDGFDFVALEVFDKLGCHARDHLDLADLGQRLVALNQVEHLVKSHVIVREDLLNLVEAWIVHEHIDLESALHRDLQALLRQVLQPLVLRATALDGVLNLLYLLLF